MERITRKDLNGILDTVNKTALRGDTSKGQYAYEMHSGAFWFGWESDATGFRTMLRGETKREMYHLVRAFLQGLTAERY
jgi:hypothetical protein